MSSRVWVCTSTHSSTKVMVLDASQPADLLDSFYACNTHVVCIASVPGRLNARSVWLCRLSFFVCVLHACIIYFLLNWGSFDSLWYFIFKVCWRPIIRQVRRYLKTWRLAKVTLCHWLVVWPVWAPRAAMVPWQQRGPPPSPKQPAQVLTRQLSKVASVAQVVPQPYYH